MNTLVIEAVASAMPSISPTIATLTAGARGATMVVVERLWRSAKYEEVYLGAYGSVSDARASIGAVPDVLHRRPHSSLDRKMPDQAYFNQPLCAAA